MVLKVLDAAERVLGLGGHFRYVNQLDFHVGLSRDRTPQDLAGAVAAMAGLPTQGAVVDEDVVGRVELQQLVDVTLG